MKLINTLLTIVFFSIVSIAQNQPVPTRYDFDGDGKADPAIYRQNAGEFWYLKSSDGGNGAAQFGNPTDFIVSADYTGDGISDHAFFRRDTGEWFVLRSEGDGFYSFPFGGAGDIAMAGDVDGDGIADPTVWRVSNATWYSLLSSDGSVVTKPFGNSGDSPKIGDYDGDGKADFAVYQRDTMQWWIDQSRDGLAVYQFGVDANDIHSLWAIDVTGDGAAELVFVYLPDGATNLEWFISPSEDRSSYYSTVFGIGGDRPAPADYDGDGKDDIGVFRPNNRTWYINESNDGLSIFGFGATTDRPAALYPATY